MLCVYNQIFGKFVKHSLNNIFKSKTLYSLCHKEVALSMKIKSGTKLENGTKYIFDKTLAIIISAPSKANLYLIF